MYCRDNHHNVYRPRSARTGLEVLTSLCVRVSGGIWTIPSTAGGCNGSRFGFIFLTLAAFALVPAAPRPTPVFCSSGDCTSLLVRCTRWHLSATGLEDVTLSVRSAAAFLLILGRCLRGVDIEKDVDATRTSPRAWRSPLRDRRPACDELSQRPRASWLGIKFQDLGMYRSVGLVYCFNTGQYMNGLN